MFTHIVLIVAAASVAVLTSLPPASANEPCLAPSSRTPVSRSRICRRIAVISWRRAPVSTVYSRFATRDRFLFPADWATRNRTIAAS